MTTYPDIQPDLADSVLEDFDSICKRLNIQYWLVFGSALGFYRDQGYIKGDSDIDVGVKCDNTTYLHLLDTMQKNGFDKIRTPPKPRGKDTGRLSWRHTWKHDIMVDIFRLDRDPHHTYATCQQALPFFNGVEYVIYNKKKYPIPTPIENYLKLCYGPNWKTPNLFKLRAQQKAIERYWKTRSIEYDQLQWVNTPTHAEQIVDIAKLNTSHSVLDVGCGTGKLIKYLTSLGINSSGIDISSAMVNLAQQKCPENDIRVGDIRSLPYAANTFDCVVASMVFHHILRDTQKALAEIHRVLVPNGKFVLLEGVPPKAFLKDWFEEMFAYKEQRRTYLATDLLQLMREGGFALDIFQYYTLPQISIGNWLKKNHITGKRRQAIWDMHVNLCKEGKAAYNMTITNDDILCDFLFALLLGKKMVK